VYQHTDSALCVCSPIILCGDFNGGPSGMQYRHLRSLNFTPSATEEMRWVTHRTHLNSTMCCDFIWFLNPSNQVGNLESNW
jgi:endonuclease/exonuclease/phosphatase (EEP) superfamily protein YafD